MAYFGYFTIVCYAIVSSLYYSLYIEDFLALGPAVKAGIEAGLGWTKEHYMTRLSQLQKLTRVMYMFERKEPIKSTYIRLTNMLQTMRVDTTNGSLREQPFCIYLYGPAGSGKTTYAIKIAAKMLREKYGKVDKSDIVILNETDSFQSEYRSYHKVVIFDDFAQQVSTAPEATNHYRKLIDFVNNVRKTCLNPNVEMKGIVQIQPEIVILTSNVPPASCYQQYVRSLGAILRRFNYIIYIDKNRHTIPIMCDHSQEKHGATVVPNSEYGRLSNRRTTDSVEKLHDFQALKIWYDDLETEVIQLFLEHSCEQKRFVTEVNQVFDNQPEKLNNEPEKLEIKKDFRFYCASFVGRHCIPDSPTYYLDWRGVVRPFMLDLYMKLKVEKVEAQIGRVVENCSKTYQQQCWEIVAGKITYNYIKNPQAKYRLEFDDVLPHDSGFTAELLYNSYIQCENIFELCSKVYWAQDIPEVMLESITTVPLSCQMSLFSMIKQLKALPTIKHRKDVGYQNETHMLTCLRDSVPIGVACIAQQRIIPGTEFDGVFISVHGGVLAVVVVELKTKLTDGAKNKGRKQLVKQVDYLRSIFTYPNIPFYGVLYGDKLSLYALQDKRYPGTEEVILGWLKRSFAYEPIPDEIQESGLTLLYSCTHTTDEDCSVHTQNSDGSHL